MALKNPSTLPHLTIVNQQANEVQVKFPSMDIPVTMTISYFNQLKASGKFVIQNCA